MQNIDSDDVQSNVNDELEAMGAIANSLDGLDPVTRERVLQWAASRYISSLSRAKVVGLHDANNSLGHHQSGNDSDTSEVGYDNLPSLFEAANPTNEADKALVVGYWYQKIQGSNDFVSQSVNTELKNFGHAVKNITAAFTSLINSNHVLQVKKTGNSQQGRKRYKLTLTGIKKVEGMLSLSSPDSNRMIKPVNEPLEVVNNEKKHSDVKANKSKPKANKSIAPSINKNLNIYQEGEKPSLKEFLGNYNTSTANTYNLLFVHYLKEIKEIEKVGLSEIYTCYKNIDGVKIPTNIKQSLWNTAHKGWLDTASIEDIKIAIAGENAVTHELRKKPEVV